MPRNSGPRGWLLPSARQWLLGMALCGLAFFLWQEVSAYRLRHSLWDPTASPSDRIRSATAWSRQGDAGLHPLLDALTNGTAQTRRYALMGLSQMGPAARPAIPALQRALRDEHPFVRGEAASVLSLVDGSSPQSAGAVAALLVDVDPTVQCEAATALYRFGDIAIPIATNYLTDANPAARRLALDVLAHVMSDHTAFAELAQPLTEDPDPELQSIAIQHVIRNQAATESQLVRWLAHEKLEIRQQAILALDENAPPREAIAPLIACVERGPTAHALYVLQKFGVQAREAVPAILVTLEGASPWETPELLKTLQSAGCDAATLAERSLKVAMNSNQAPAAAALTILKSVDPDRARREIDRRIEQLQEGDTKTIGEVCSTLRYLPPEDIAPALPVLESLLFSDSREVRSAVLSVIRSAKAARSASALAKLLDSPLEDSFVPELAEAIEAIGTAGADELRDPLLRYIRGDAEKRSETEASAVASRCRLTQAAGRIGIRSPEFLNFLFAALDDRSVPMREGALEAFGALGAGDDRVLTAFLKSLESKEPGERLVATQQILDAVGPRVEIVEGLIPMLDDPDLGIRAVAAITLARMGGKASQALHPLREALRDSSNALAIGRSRSLRYDRWYFEVVLPIMSTFSGERSVSQVLQAAIDHIESHQEFPAP